MSVFVAGVALASSLLAVPDARALAGPVEEPAVFDNNGLIIAVGTSSVAMDENGNSWRYVPAGDEPAWSPDGQRVVFQDDDGELVVSELDGGNAQVLTDTATYEWKPAWSPDGNKIAFMRDSAIWVMDADGSNQHQVTSICCNSAPSWSPDGTKLVFDSNRDGGAWHIYMIDLASGEPAVKLTDSTGHNRWPDWSPDGSKIVFVTTRTGPNNLWVMDAGGSNEVALTTEAGHTERDPQWSPDGERVVFSRDLKVAFVDADGSDLTMLSVSGSAPDWQPLPACTVTGTDGPDDLQGTSAADVLCGGDGNDVLAGGGGDDILLGQGGSDTLTFDAAGPGIDVNLQNNLILGEGNDFALLSENATGTRSADTLRGNEAENRLDGDEGDDAIAPGWGADQVLGGAGVDTVVGTYQMDLDLAAGTLQEGFTGSNIDSLTGVENARGRTDQADTLRGDDGPNVLDGGGGNSDQVLQGRGGDDVIIGSGTAVYSDAPGPITADLAAGTADGDGHDTLIDITNIEGSDHNDHLSGLPAPQGSTIAGHGGDDVIISGPDHGWLLGGPGIDTLHYAGATSGVTLDLVTGKQSYKGQAKPPVLDFENVNGTPYADTLTGTPDANLMAGGAGGDLIAAGFGDDEIVGGSGNDLLTPGPGDDQVDGGTGTDRVSFERATNGMTIDLVLRVATGLGVDRLFALEDVTGSAYADVIRGGAGPNGLRGGSRKDVIYGRGGRDWLIGDSGRDQTYGGGGQDVLRARDGEPDLVSGGKERDACYFDRLDRVRSCP